ncbi:hypothetical protein ZWY2020_027509 [Hordeum vulgare]|nr:hypothetical protein ZWY2020_027509 [Hordeum vulgare]
MEVIFSAVIGELASRSISFLVDRYLKRMAAPTEEERLRSLQRLLLRVRVVVEEADGRLITNQAMMHQLGMLKEEMYRWYYALDMLSCQAHGEDRTKDHEVSYSFAPSKFNPAKRVCFCGRQGAAHAELMERVLGSVRDTIEDASEFAMFLNRCPRLNCQPYITYVSAAEQVHVIRTPNGDGTDHELPVVASRCGWESGGPADRRPGEGRKEHPARLRRRKGAQTLLSDQLFQRRWP